MKLLSFLTFVSLPMLIAAEQANAAITDATKFEDTQKDKNRLLTNFMNPGQKCVYSLTSVGRGTAKAYVWPNRVLFKFRNAEPKTLYTVWIDYMNRASKKLSNDYPINTGKNSKTGNGVARGVAPCLATTAPVYEGMRVDLNGVITDNNGNADLMIRLNYNLLKRGQSPVVAETLTMQGENRVGGSWLRYYSESIASGPSKQTVDGKGRPKVRRSTAQGFTIVAHTSHISHGHTPGVGGTDHNGAFIGDFPDNCKK